MKTLELHQMEKLHGGRDCASTLGFAAGLALGGLAIAATGGTAAVVVGAAIWETGGYFAVTAPCFGS